MLNMKNVEEVSLSKDSRFRFRCHKGIACFTKCCSNIDILLTPYDIVRLKIRLRMSSGEFLAQYTYVEIDEKTSYPFVFLKMNQDEARACPFVSAEGCTVYADRPASCRYYPLGQASLKKLDESLNKPVTEEFYFFVKEPHCLGFHEDKEWTVGAWRNDQEVDVYDDMNRGWKEILFKRHSLSGPVDEKKQKAFYMACYDIDRFRRFVFESRFLELFAIDEETISTVKNDELALMKFGFEYTKYILLMEQTLSLRHKKSTRKKKS